MTKLAISLFGSFQVALDGAPLSGFESDKVRALLAYLAVEADAAHRREHLAALLWPEHPERRGLHSLSQALYNLRTTLQDRRSGIPPYLLVSPETIQFNLKCDCWLDAAEFTRLVAASERHAHPVLEACQPCNERFEQAIRLYRGDFLADIAIRDSAAYEEWALITRERLRLHASQALASLSGYHERQGHTQDALQAAWWLAEQEPYDDGACQQTMRLLAACGKHSEALAHYQRFRSGLRADLDLTPQAETQALYERIRRTSSAKSRVAGRLHNLPASLSPLIGREDELAEVQQRLLDPGCRLLTVLGPGGSGKSRLALEAVRGLVERYAHGACLVPLSPLTALEAVVPNVAGTLGLQIKENKAPLAQVQDYLRPKELLLLLDGCEGMLEGAPLFLEMMRSAPGLKILATSRARLNLEEEQVYLLGGLKCASPQDLDQAANSAAVRLFTSGARRVQPGFDLNRQNLQDVVQICAEAQGMPLAILLAAAWTEILSPREILAEMRRNLDFLQADWPDLPLRQRSMRATFDYSWDLMERGDQQVFQALCLFRGGFTRQTAEVVSGASLAVLRRLVDKSLLMLQAGEWYAVHDLLRQYGLEKLSASPAMRQDAGVRYSRYYLDRLVEWEAGLKSARRLETLAEMDARLNDLRPAWDWAGEQGDSERLSLGLEGLCLYYEMSARFREGLSACREAGDMLACLETREAGWLRARALAWQCRFHRLLGERDLARQRLEECRALVDGMDGSGPDVRLAQAMLHLEAGEAVFTADLASAQRNLELSLELYRAAGDAWRTAGALRLLGINRHHTGDFAGSDQRLNQAIELYQGLGVFSGIANAQRIIAQNQVRQGKTESALRLMRQVIANSQAAGDRGRAAQDQRVLGLLLLWNGQYAEGLALLQEGVAVAEDLGDLYDTTFTHVAIGIGLQLSGQYELSRQEIGLALQLARDNDFQREAASCLWSQGCLALLEKSPQKARPYFSESTEIYRQIGLPDELTWQLALEAYCLLHLGQPEEARQRLAEALEITLSVKGYASALFTLAACAAWLCAQGELEQALEVYSLAALEPIFCNSTWFKDEFGSYIASCTNQLDVEAAASACERGRQRQLWATVEEMSQALRAESPTAG